MLYMIKGIELLLLPIIAFVVYTKPRVLVEFSGSVLGKVMMVLIVIGAASHKQLYGIIAATAMILILENNYEGFDVANISKLLSDSQSKGANGAEEVVAEEVDAEEVGAEEVGAEEVVAEEVDAEEVEAGTKKDGFIGAMLSKIGITSSNERIDTERNLQQGKCSNEEFTKMY
jgi:hypothetical protein